MFRDLDLRPVYDSSEYDLILDLIVPLLSHAKEYYRGVGFFTSGWLQVASEGVVQFVEHGGIARIIMSPIMQKGDWEAFQLGVKAREDETLHSVLQKSIEDLARSLKRDTLDALAWMIADEIIDFKFAVPRNLPHEGDYHDKVAVFFDDSGDVVAIHGSFNDSIQGTLNGEAFSVFKSWIEGQAGYVDIHRKRLLQLWDSGNNQFRVFSIPDAARHALIQLRTSQERPYLLNSIAQEGDVNVHPGTITLYPCQREAVDLWKRAGYRGVFEMATGTGKTIAALEAAAECRRKAGRLGLIILVPYLHLLEQWKLKCLEYGFFPILCSGEHDMWHLDVQSKIQDYNVRAIDNFCILAINATASTDKFSKALRKCDPKTTMLIGDEVHGLGAPQYQRALIPNASLRLGLSATPRRWFDEQGSQVIFSYFGDVCFEYPLSKAIEQHYLTPYEYNPVLVSLSAAETDEYERLSRQIVFLSSKTEVDKGTEKQLKLLLIERVRVIAAAEAKLPTLLGLLNQHIAASIQTKDELHHILIYCAPASHREVLFNVARLGLRCHEFVHTVPMKDRTKILRQFSDGDIQVLVAVKCLDEGVDVPATRAAYFLASTSNPREFIQRRGRILRLAKSKTKALIYDFVVVPPPSSIELRREVDVSILKREMPRFAEFSSSAMNEFQSRAVIRDILDKMQLLNLLDEKPWEIYRRNRSIMD